MRQHVAVWMDGEEARVFHVRKKGLDEATGHSPRYCVQRHPKDDLARTGTRPEGDHHFFRELAGPLEHAGRILLLGPSTATLLFLRYLQRSAPEPEARIIGLETADHPSDGEMAAYVRRYFWSSHGAVTQSDRQQMVGR